MTTKLASRLFAFALATCAASLRADTATINIDATKPGPEINPRMYGIFLEEINTGVDGGLYAELIRNRGFEDAKPPEGFSFINGRWDNGRGYVIPYHFEVDKSLPYWSLVKEGGAQGSMSLDMSNPLNSATPRSCRLEIQDVSSGRIGIANEGYWGIGVKEGEQYVLSFWARGDVSFTGPLVATLESARSEPVSDAVTIKKIDGQWKHYTATLTAKRNEPQAKFILTAGSKGTVWLDMVSLFPKKTFKDHANGLRPEIAQMIADLKPGFVRFPGGCVVEGATPENAYDWKKSIGPIEQREEIWNVWDYRRTHGMGFYEYLQFCEDIGAEPMYVGFAGQTCIYRHSTNVPISEMQPIEDSFLDALEFANGPANSKWGKLRADAGHPASFNVKLLEIGNENVGREYEDRYALIYPLVKAKYPGLTTLANVPLRRSPVEMVDEHYYNNPRWFINNFHMYDRRDRKSPPIYIAEVAVTSQEGGRDKGNLISALAEGVFLMGAECNADVVRMVSYAPLLANVHGRTELAGAPPPWHGLIYFDSSRVFGTASYYLWKLFGENRPSRTLKTDVALPENENFKVGGQIGLGTWDTSAEFKDVRVEKNGQAQYTSDFMQNAKGWQSAGRRGGGQWAVTNGVYRQNQPGRASSYFGDENWSDYTLTLKARKLGGGEGFLIMFGRKGGDMYWWNLGGWGNTRHAIEHSVQGSQTPVGAQAEGRIETGRWYDIKVELNGNRIRCYLDGRLIHDETAQPNSNLFAVAGRDDKKGDLVVKVINTSSQPYSSTLNIDGVTSMSPEAQVTLLTSARTSDNNSLESPTKVVPTTTKAAIPGTKFTYEFPANSLVILRLKAKSN
jgi:alpha-L-arabinofuranosidase